MQPFSCASRSLYLPECIQSDLEFRSPQSRSVSEQNVLPSVMQRTVSVCTLGSFHLASPMYFFFFLHADAAPMELLFRLPRISSTTGVLANTGGAKAKTQRLQGLTGFLLCSICPRPTPELMSHDFGPALPFTRHPATAHIAKYWSKRHNPSNHGLCNHYGGVLVD